MSKRYWTRTLAFVAFVSTGILTAGAPVMAGGVVEYHSSRPGMPFSEAVRVGKMLYLSGRLGTTEDGQLVPGGIAAETRAAMTRIKEVAERYGSSMDRMVRCTVFLVDMKEWPKMNEVYTTFFDKNLPARSAVAVSGLARGARVEIECMGTIAD